MKTSSFQTLGLRWFQVTGTIALALTTTACGRGMCDIPGSARAGGADALQIQDYGPRAAVAGQPFNQQPDGRSAAWFRMPESVEGSVVNVHLNNTVAEGHISGNLVTVQIPDAMHATEGAIVISLDKVDGSQVTKSNVVTIAVSKP